MLFLVGNTRFLFRMPLQCFSVEKEKGRQKECVAPNVQSWTANIAALVLRFPRFSRVAGECIHFDARPCFEDGARENLPPPSCMLMYY
uniref:Uncharacterized protein n=1 Tax=Arundo donax TaxID=35708 RepID=A0A0A8XX43_ARUDO